MAKQITFQEGLVKSATEVLDEMIPSGLTGEERNNYRLTILEKCASAIGGFNYNEYCKSIKWQVPRVEINYSLSLLVEAIKKIDLPESIVLSILSDDETDEHHKRKTGSYYTDFRLASKLAESLAGSLQMVAQPKIIDLSAGAGILLSSIALCLSKTTSINAILVNSIYGADLSENALRGTLLSLSSMTSEINVIKSLRKHLFRLDSLQTSLSRWMELVPEKFDGIIGNPPWEKLKLSMHEYLKSNGHDRHYGDTITNKETAELLNLKKQLKEYIASIKHLLPNTKTEVDLYIPFLKLALQLTKNGGYIAQIIPASLIRNQGVEALRKELFNSSADLNISILNNKARFFKIDSRFKFLMLTSKIGESSPGFNLNHSKIINQSIQPNRYTHIIKDELFQIRHDFSIPEIKNQKEWELFKKISFRFSPFGSTSSNWLHEFNREVDMSLNKKHFKRNKAINHLPIIEGRMIHQFKAGIKAYVSGTGRKAVWKEKLCSNEEKFEPQFYIETCDIPVKQSKRAISSRVGFCDITGQTNERTMLATMIPAECICGNKVPTIDFLRDDNFRLSYLWIAIANSFVFDWLIRKTITTNANFFIVDGVPIPEPNFNDPLIVEITKLSKKLVNRSSIGFDWEFGKLRSRIDAFVAQLYKLSFEEYKLILNDFPILDKLQPKIGNESACTLTKDIALLNYLECSNVINAIKKDLDARIDEYKKIGSIPYVPSQFIKLMEKANIKKKWNAESQLVSL